MSNHNVPPHDTGASTRTEAEQALAEMHGIKVDERTNLRTGV